MVFKFLQRWPKVFWGLIISAFGMTVVLAIIVFGIWRWYLDGQQPPLRDSTEVVLFRVDLGQGIVKIGENLEAANLVKNHSVFRWYVRLGGHYDQFQAGDFRLSPAMTVAEIVQVLKHGQSKNFAITILPRQRLEQIKESLVEQNFNQDVVDQALRLENYRDHPVAQYWPEDIVDLEGYIFPETFFVTGFEVDDLKSVISRSLDKLNQALNEEDLLTGFAEQKISPHQGVILASIVLHEVGDRQPEDQAKVAQVFLRRYREGGSLGSDVVFFYAYLSGKLKPPVDFSLDHPYNSRLRKGLPPSPISNPSLSALKAVARPAATNYYFFLVGDDGQIYFNRDYSGHLKDRRDHCREACLLPNFDLD